MPLVNYSQIRGAKYKIQSMNAGLNIDNVVQKSRVRDRGKKWELRSKGKNEA